MKRWLIILTVLLLAALTGCSQSANGKSTTLLIYMVGSDLEAKAGAASKDLDEIAQSGVDLTRNKVLVYAGGTPNWHNDAASSQQHRILELTPDGFIPIAATESRSMGDSYCLTNFLNYAWEMAPSEQFALILWNHGDGPVIGYGRDMLFDNDSLTLKEMAKALVDSPFGADNKLAWVGFDACLMASAELSCTLAPYAEYLLASQEVEPSFGWDYSFLSDLGATDTPTLLANAAGSYLNTCLAYYDSRDYDHRDTTLSCVDLSQTEALDKAINALFSQAKAGVSSQYHQLAARRVQTRALGRTTTGSEYDLIDLWDLANQLSDLYPQEAESLQAVLAKMVTVNASNTTGCCGISLYYPFYNKDYYTQSWSQAYRDLGLFPEYQAYLQAYQSVWLEDDLLDTVAASQRPAETAGTYTLQLTPAQQEVFASARYYILIRDGEAYYTRAFSSEDVTNENGLLTANFDGNVLYVRDNYGNFHIPVSREHDTVGDQTRYSVYSYLMNCGFGRTGIPEDFEVVTQPSRFSLSLDNTTGEVSVNGLTAYDFQNQQDRLPGGKLEEADLSDWASCFFFNAEHRFLTRDEKGTILGLEQWPADAMMSGVDMSIGNGVEFIYAPLAEGEYYLIFEVEDTQGSRYCSELLPIEVEGQLPAMTENPAIELDFSAGDRIELIRQAGVTVTLYKDGVHTYRLEVTNENAFPVYLPSCSLFWGEETYCGAVTGSLVVQPGQTASKNYGFHMGDAMLLAPEAVEDIMTLRVQAENAITGEYLIYDQPIRIRLSEDTVVVPEENPWVTFQLPVLDAQAGGQVLLDTAQARVTLLGMGSNGLDGALRGGICIENPTDQPLQLELEGLAINGMYLSANTHWGAIPAGCRIYRCWDISQQRLEESGITSIGEVTLLLRQAEVSPIYSGNSRSQLTWCPVTLDQSGTAGAFPEGDRVLMEENGIRVTLLRQEETDTGCTWTLSIVNTTENAVSAALVDQSQQELYLQNAQIGPGQCCIAALKLYDREKHIESVDFRLRIMDFLGEAIAFNSENVITLYAKQ